MSTSTVSRIDSSRSAAKPPAIEVRGVSKWFDSDGARLMVLDNIDLDVCPCCILAILGASGSGKSTLLNIISGIQKPSRGQVTFSGIPSDRFSDWNTISYMFQDDRLLPWRTALHNVEFALEAGSIPRHERLRRAREALHLVDLGEFEEAFPYQLSGGMRSRVALARSLVTEPTTLLMDEPFSRLDAQTRSLMHAEVLRIHGIKHMTVLFVTHDVEEAVILADDVAVMSPRPGHVREVAAIDLPRPRDPTDPAVTAYIQRVRALI
jgi:NitT/TauT family transport system ATP-binding protein